MATLTVAVADTATIAAVVPVVIGVLVEVILLLLCEAFGAMAVTAVCPDIDIAVGVHAAFTDAAWQTHLLSLNELPDPHWATYNFES